MSAFVLKDLDHCSSISGVNDSRELAVPEALTAALSYDPEISYARSKLVAEYVHANAAKATGMTGQILRICHIVDDTKIGI